MQLVDAFAVHMHLQRAQGRTRSEEVDLLKAPPTLHRHESLEFCLVFLRRISTSEEGDVNLPNLPSIRGTVIVDEVVKYFAGRRLIIRRFSSFTVIYKEK